MSTDPDQLERAVNLALGNHKDQAVRELRNARLHLNDALIALERDDWSEAANYAREAAKTAADGAARAGELRGAAEMASLLDLRGTDG